MEHKNADSSNCQDLQNQSNQKSAKILLIVTQWKNGQNVGEISQNTEHYFMSSYYASSRMFKIEAAFKCP